MSAGLWIAVIIGMVVAIVGVLIALNYEKINKNYRQAKNRKAD